MANSSYPDPLTGKLLPERRVGAIRRGGETLFSMFSSKFRRRRSKGRRKTDEGAYVDVYDWQTWFIAITVLILSGVDAALTALHIIKGTAVELNPIMAAVINHGGVPAFLAAKAAMTIFPLAVIFAHKEWRVGKFAAHLCLWVYALLSLYHLYLLYVLS